MSSVDFGIAILIFIFACIASYLLNRKTSESHHRGDSIAVNNSNNSMNTSSSHQSTGIDHPTNSCFTDTTSHSDGAGCGGGGGD